MSLNNPISTHYRVNGSFTGRVSQSEPQRSGAKRITIQPLFYSQTKRGKKLQCAFHPLIRADAEKRLLRPEQIKKRFITCSLLLLICN